MTLGNVYGFWWFWVWIKPWCLSRSGAYPVIQPRQFRSDQVATQSEKESWRDTSSGTSFGKIFNLVLECQYGWAFLKPHGQMVCFDGEVHYFDILWRLNFPLLVEVCSNSPCFVNVGPAPSGRFWRMAWIDTHYKEKERERKSYAYICLETYTQTHFFSIEVFSGLLPILVLPILFWGHFAELSSLLSWIDRRLSSRNNFQGEDLHGKH